MDTNRAPHIRTRKQTEIMLMPLGGTYTSTNLTQYRFIAQYVPSKMPTLKAAYFEVVAWLSGAPASLTVHLRKNVGAGDAAVVSIPIVGSVEDATCLYRSADCLAALGTTDGIVYTGREAANNGGFFHMARLILEYED